MKKTALGAASTVVLAVLATRDLPDFRHCPRVRAG